MKCPTCQGENPESAEYCQYCGTKLVRICSSCSTANPATYIFCGECGHKLSVEQEPQEAAVAPTPEPVKEAAPQPTSAVKWEEVAPAPLRISTGIQGLDPLIGGGFLANKVYLVSGEAGVGKTIFGLQFIYSGLILGESCIYATADEKVNHIFDDARSLGWDFAKYVEAKKLVIMGVSTRFADLRSGEVKLIDTHDMVDALAKQVKSVGASRLVIDPVAPLIYGEQSSVFIQGHILNLILEVEDNVQCTTLVTSDIIAGNPGLSRYGVEEFVTEGVIILGMTKENGHRVRILSVRKMRSTDADIQDHAFQIIAQRGIVLDT